MGVDGLLCVRGEQCGRLTITEISKGRLKSGRIFPHIRPAFNGLVGWRGRLAPILAPMPPDINRGSISGRCKPALVSHRNLSYYVTRGGGGRCNRPLLTGGVCIFDINFRTTECKENDRAE